MVNKFFKKKKVLITGATGFKGAWLCQILNLFNSNILGIGFKPNKNQNLFNNLKLNNKIKLKYTDIRDYKKLSNIIKQFQPQIIFHLAAQPIIFQSYKDPYETININSTGTLNILDICKDLKSLRSIVCITSDKCYANNFSTRGFKETDHLGGTDPYSASKASAEIIINAYKESFFSKKKIGIASARAGNVIGGGDWSPNRLIPDTINSLLKNKVINIRNPGFNRPWQHVLEPINGYLILSENLYKNPKKYSGAWNFGSEKNTVTSVYEVVNKIIKIWGSGKIIFKKNFKYYEQKNLQLNIEKAKKDLKWKPLLSINQSVKNTVDWYKEVHINKSSSQEVTKKQIIEYFENVKKNKKNTS
jgi:CDP-glucose 4,6-dehydratase